MIIDEAEISSIKKDSVYILLPAAFFVLSRAFIIPDPHYYHSYHPPASDAACDHHSLHKGSPPLRVEATFGREATERPGADDFTGNHMTVYLIRLLSSVAKPPPSCCVRTGM